MNKRFVIMLVACVAIFFGLVFFIKKDAKSPSNGPAVASNHVEGKGTTGVNVTEYGDYQCPACGAYYPVFKQIVATYGDKIVFQFRNFPLVSLHPNAMSAARAAEAASLQGKFWEMHDLLYERQDSWNTSKNPSEIFKAYAQQLGLDTDQFNSDLGRADIYTTIQADIKAGTDLHINATPGIVIDGKLVDDNTIRNITDITKIIDQAIKNKQ